MSFGLSLIVRNGARTLRRALAPFRGIVDEIVAVDTGSTDDTIPLLEEFGARIVMSEWRDDFGAARNLALEHGTADWFLSLDADEWVDPGDAMRLRDLVRGDADAYVIDTMNFLTSSDAGTFPTVGADRGIAPFFAISSKIRLARRTHEDSRIRWEGAVHELLDYSARRAGYRIAHAPVFIRHDGFFGKRASTYYEDLCRKSWREGTAHPGILTTLGVIALSRHDTLEAETMLREAMTMDDRFDRPVIWLGRMLQRIGRSDEAVAVLMAGMKKCPPSAELTCLLIDVFRERGEITSAAAFLDVARKLFADSPWLARLEARD